jgi:hypothetical protein
MGEELREQLSKLKERLPIDPLQLERECMGQPALYTEAGELASTARAEAKQAKEHLEFTKAQLSAKIRGDTDKYVVGKVTEASIDSAIITHEEYVKAVAESINASRLADDLSVLQTAVEQRKSMIRDLVQLFIHSYYSNNQDMTNEQGKLGGVTKEQIVQKRIQTAQEREEIEEVEE